MALEEVFNANGSCRTAIAPDGVLMRVKILLVFRRNMEWDAEMFQGPIVTDWVASIFDEIEYT